MKLLTIGLDLPSFRQFPAWQVRSISPTVGLVCKRCASSSSKRWLARQRNDPYTREAMVQGLKSRAAFKLLQVCTAPPITAVIHAIGGLFWDARTDLMGSCADRRAVSDFPQGTDSR